MKRFLWLGCVLLIYVICTGCGDTFRPIIIPNPPGFPNPQAAHTVVAINDNAPASGPDTVFGTAMVIDVSGDSDQSIANVGLAPVHAVQQSASEILVVNRSVNGALRDSVTKLNFGNTSIGSTSTISMPPNSAPNFVATTESSEAYVSLPNYLDPNTNTVVPSIAVVNTNSNSITNTIPLGAGAAPVAIVETPDAKKLYVANYGSGTISGFNTVGESPRLINGNLSNPPIWLAARSDSQAVYALEGTTGTLAWINTSTTAGPDTLAETGISVPGANLMTYDPNLLRLYIPGGQEAAIVDISQSPPQLIATIPIPSFTLLNLPSVPAIASGAAALPDGSRAYVSSYAVLPSQLNVTSVSGDGTNATYAYTLTAGHDLTAGASVTVAGTQQSGFDGTFIVGAIVSGTAICPGACFQVPNTTALSSTPVSALGTGSNIFPQVTVVNATSNTVATTVAIPGFPDATNPTYANGVYYVPNCANTRDTVGPLGSGFRFMMAAGGDSTRTYLSSCDGGLVDIINTSTDAYLVNITAPIGIRQIIPPALQNPPMNPIFLIAGP
ncbi:MAG TPA: hypothetical protein VK828_21545 [Terriglobales bacterium]|jgi:hypothetical protein|nr:hypothetical protein [Terriglobales bacterium]